MWRSWVLHQSLWIWICFWFRSFARLLSSSNGRLQKSKPTEAIIECLLPFRWLCFGGIGRNTTECWKRLWSSPKMWNLKLQHVLLNGKLSSDINWWCACVCGSIFKIPAWDLPKSLSFEPSSLDTHTGPHSCHICTDVSDVWSTAIQSLGALGDQCLGAFYRLALLAQIMPCKDRGIGCAKPPEPAMHQGWQLWTMTNIQNQPILQEVWPLWLVKWPRLRMTWMT